jgi:hypothetical protein
MAWLEGTLLKPVTASGEVSVSDVTQIKPNRPVRASRTSGAEQIRQTTVRGTVSGGNHVLRFIF